MTDHKQRWLIVFFFGNKAIYNYNTENINNYPDNRFPVDTVRSTLLKHLAVSSVR